MRRFLAPLLLILLLPATAGAVVKPPKVTATATGSGGAAASVDPYATKTAIDVLRKGGNAVDAAVAAASVLGVVEPYSSGIGGGGFMLIRTASGHVSMIDGREFAPAAFTDTSFIDPDTQQPLPFDQAVTSGLGVGVPGTPATWQLALNRFGTMQLRKLLKPSIKIARQGFIVDDTLQKQTEANAARFADFPATARIYLPGGAPIQGGTVLKNPGLARTLAFIGRKGVQKGFYRGKLASQIVATVTAPQVTPGSTRNVRPGVMTTADLDAYRAIRRAPVSTDYRRKTFYGAAPPSSGGTTVGEILNIMESFGKPAQDGVTELHREIEAERLAYADRGKYLGDPAFVSVPVDCLLSQAFADQRRALITDAAGKSPVPAGDCPAPSAAASTSTEGPNTTHLSVADAAGNIVSYTFTIEQTGGSGMVVPRRGFLLNNELTDFTFTPGTANSAAARKRPRSSISPTIITRGDRPVLTVGSPGGSTIITTVAQILLDRFERGMTLQDAIADPRVSEQNSATGAPTQAEPAFIGSADGKVLAANGYQFATPTDPEIGAATGIEFDRGGQMTAAAEPNRRGGGSAMVVRPR
ncbi:MAG: gamma-glutamyltranspeptidase / glutathione hydrolase [Solirubrobacteraceae bacterium]|nr:gamma-glutamyltranspeptidase / glutathione hydrolase [Solirubrobacteraceae bacterium]